MSFNKLSYSTNGGNKVLHSHDIPFPFHYAPVDGATRDESSFYFQLLKSACDVSDPQMVLLQKDSNIACMHWLVHILFGFSTNMCRIIWFKNFQRMFVHHQRNSGPMCYQVLSLDLDFYFQSITTQNRARVKMFSDILVN